MITSASWKLHVMDVSDVGSCRRGVAEAAARLGGLDILINNAGVEQVCASIDVEEELWDRIVDTNLKGAFFAAQAAARLMKGGAILNICSLTSERGIPTAVPYGSSKTGLAGMSGRDPGAPYAGPVPRPVRARCRIGILDAGADDFQFDDDARHVRHADC